MTWQASHCCHAARSSPIRNLLCSTELGSIGRGAQCCAADVSLFSAGTSCLVLTILQSTVAYFILVRALRQRTHLFLSPTCVSLLRCKVTPPQRHLSIKGRLMVSPVPRGPPDTPSLPSASPVSARRTSRRKSTTISYQESTASEAEEGVLPSLPSTKSVKRKRSSKATADEDFGAQDSHGEGESGLTALEDGPSPAASAKKLVSPKKKQRRKKAAVPAEPTAEGDTVANAEEASPKKPRKPRKPRETKPEPVYVIPDVEKLETTFKGRLGAFEQNTESCLSHHAVIQVTRVSTRSCATRNPPRSLYFAQEHVGASICLFPLRR